MKKLLMTLSLMSLAGAAAFGVSSLVSGKTALEVKADSDPVTYIAMSADAFTNETDAYRLGQFAPTSRTYWDGWSFDALDTFFCGESMEGETGTLELKSWTQFTQYIYFQWGAAGTADQYLEFICTNTTAEEGEQYYQHEYKAEHRNDTQVDNKLLVRYFKIPDDEYAKLGGDNGFSMTIKLHDNGGDGGYKFHSFGWLHPNQTKEEVGDAMRFYLNHLNQNLADYEVGARKRIQGHYFTNAYLKDIFYATAADISDGFNSQSDFTKHWYFDHTYYNNDGAGRDFDRAISSVANHANGAPYNKEGAGFFRGFHESDENTGFQATDCSMYRFISRPFVVDTNNPFISIKMGGAASLHIIDATVNPDVNQAADLGWVDNKFYSLSGTDPLVYTGWMATTMVRHVVNLQAYAGRTVQLAIADISGETNWKAANFDELQVNFTPTAFKIDTLTQVNNENTYYSTLADKYISSAHDGSGINGIKYKTAEDAVLDTTEVKAAATYLASFYASTRDTGSHTTYCTNLVSDDMKGLVNTFNALGDGVKTIVADSDDFDQYDKNIADWFRTPVEKFTVNQTLNYIALRNGINVENNGGLINSNFFGGNHMWNYIALTVIVSAAAVLGFFLIKRRKAKAE